MASNMTTHNMDDGFADAFLRGLRSTFLSDMEYANLKEGGNRGGSGAGGEKSREDFEDLRLTLQETDYGNFLQAEPALDPKIIANRCTAKWVKEFKYIRATATGNLARFMDFVTYEYMIDNILDLIKAATSSQSVDMEAVVENCHPLGMLEPAVMKSILAYEDLAEDFHALYRTVLVDTPVGKYFTMFLQETVDEKSAMDPESVRSTFTEIPITLVENSIKKFYLEDFYYFCKEEIGGETGVVMGELLETRADMLAINIAYNSLHTELRGAGGRSSRQELFPAFGHLYPGGAVLLADAEDEEGMRRALQKSVPGYVALWDSAPVDGRGVRDLSDAFFRYTVKQLELAFDGQFHYSPFYAYAKLKEQECKNIAWIATCMEHGVYSEVDRIVPVFSRVVAKR